MGPLILDPGLMDRKSFQFWPHPASPSGALIWSPWQQPILWALASSLANLKCLLFWFLVNSFPRRCWVLIKAELLTSENWMRQPYKDLAVLLQAQGRYKLVITEQSLACSSTVSFWGVVIVSKVARKLRSMFFTSSLLFFPIYFHCIPTLKSFTVEKVISCTISPLGFERSPWSSLIAPFFRWGNRLPGQCSVYRSSQHHFLSLVLCPQSKKSYQTLGVQKRENDICLLSCFLLWSGHWMWFAGHVGQELYCLHEIGKSLPS